MYILFSQKRESIDLIVAVYTFAADDTSASYDSL